MVTLINTFVCIWMNMEEVMCEGTHSNTDNDKNVLLPSSENLVNNITKLKFKYQFMSRE